jgi:hypothetical protein
MTHQELEKFEIGDSRDGISILELGAQADQHRSWVETNYQSYIVSDIDLKPLLKSKVTHEMNLSQVDLKVATSMPDIRFEQIKTITERIKANQDKLQIIGGDFNCTILSTEIQYLMKEANLIESFSFIHPDKPHITLVDYFKKQVELGVDFLFNR